MGRSTKRRRVVEEVTVADAPAVMQSAPAPEPVLPIDYTGNHQPTPFQLRVSREMMQNILESGRAELEGDPGVGKSMATGIASAKYHHNKRSAGRRPFTIFTSGARNVEKNHLVEFGVSVSDYFSCSNPAQRKALMAQVASGREPSIFMSLRSFYFGFGAMGPTRGFCDSDQGGSVHNIQSGTLPALPPMIKILIELRITDLLVVVDEHQFAYRSVTRALPTILANLKALGRRGGFFKTDIMLVSKGPDLSGTENNANTTAALGAVYLGLDLDPQDRSCNDRRSEIDQERLSIVSKPTDADLGSMEASTGWMAEKRQHSGHVEVMLASPTDTNFYPSMIDSFTVAQLFDYEGGTFNLGLDKPVHVYKSMPRTQENCYAITDALIKRSMNGFYATADTASFFQNNFLPGHGDFAFNPKNPKRVTMRRVVDASDPLQPRFVPVEHFHALLVIVGTHPSRSCRESLCRALASSSRKTKIFDFTSIHENELDVMIRNEVKPVFELNEQMAVVVINQGQVDGSNAFDFFTASVLTGCCASIAKNKYFQSQGHGRLARPRTPAAGDVFPVKNGYEFMHICSSLTVKTASQRKPGKVLSALQGNGDFDGNPTPFLALHDQLALFGLSERFCRNFFVKTQGKISPLTIDGKRAEFLGKQLLTLATMKQEDTPAWRSKLSGFIRRFVKLQTSEFDED